MFETLIERIGKKRIVLLGESAHGVREFNTLRVELVKELNESLGFDVLMIESTPESASQSFSEMEPKKFIESFLHPAFHTEEFVELLMEAKHSGMSVGGFEIVREDLDHYRSLVSASKVSESRTFRDWKMFKNLEKQLDTVYAGKKVIVWAHNAHLMRKSSSPHFRKQVVGELLHEKYGDEVFIVGQYAGSGTFEHLPGDLVTRVALPGSIEEYICALPAPVTVFPELKGTSLDQTLRTFSNVNTEEHINVAEYFDALVLHREGSVPVRF